MNINLRTIYMYLFSLVGLFIVVFGSIMLVNLSIKTVIFPDADRNQFYYPTPSEPKLSAEDMKIQQDQQDKDTARQHQRDLAQAVAMILVGAPLYLYHWKTIQKDHALSQK